MKKNQILLVVLFSNLIVRGQSFENPENFKAGTVLKFQECQTDSIFPGSSGKNRVWDFSKLKQKTNSILTEEIVNANKTPYKKDFKEADFAEKNSDGTWVFYKINNNQNFLTGYVDDNSKMKMMYSDPMLFAKRPVQFSDSITDTFKRTYTVNQMDMTGSGTITIVADGTGTLILPNGTFENVLRIRIEIIQLDAPVQYASWPSKSIQKTWTWFDNKHTSALLKIDITESPYFNNKEVKYLLEEKQKK